MDVTQDLQKLVGGSANLDWIELSEALAKAKILARCKGLIAETETVPEDLRHVVLELSIARYNRIGSEGMSSESVGGGSQSYLSDEEILDSYQADFETWANEAGDTGTKVVRFL